MNFNNCEEFECAKHLKLQSCYGKGSVNRDGGTVVDLQHFVSPTDRKRDVRMVSKHANTFNQVSLCLEGNHHDMLMVGHKHKAKLKTDDVHLLTSRKN